MSVLSSPSTIPDSLPVTTPVTAALQQFVRQQWDLTGDWQTLAGYDDQNLLLTTSQGQFVVKVAGAGSDYAALDLQVKAQQFISQAQAATPAALQVPSLLPAAQGELFLYATDLQRFVRVQQYLAGTPCHAVPLTVRDHSFYRSLGQQVGALSRQLSSFSHPYACRPLHWDLLQAPLRCRQLLPGLTDQLPATTLWQLRSILQQVDSQLVPQLASLPKALIHNDANDHNLLLQCHNDKWQPSALLDFGDMVYSLRSAELAVLLAYLLPDAADPLAAMQALCQGFTSSYPLQADELMLLPLLVQLRYCLSLVNSAAAIAGAPDNAYLLVSRAQVLRGLSWFATQNSTQLAFALQQACGLGIDSGAGKADLLARRQRQFSKSLSLSYREPLKIIRGSGAYLFDEQGRDYLDMVNNVCHVGHCQPQVVTAASQQMAQLNTNTRYLHDNLLNYSEALLAKFPEPLSVCFLVNSGSEANELALRIARTVSGKRDVLVVEGAYHGNSNACIDISPYKFMGKGGAGKPAHVHIAPLPYPFRGRYRGYDTAPLYVRDAMAVAQAAAHGVGAFITEAVQGVPGQIVMPPGYLSGLYQQLQSQGTLCIADEVQIGFGRLGQQFWGFATQQVVPDIVTLGKPIGNGHPMGAVITTRAIADAFANGMEYFNTFGGNPVSCAVGLAVLDVIDQQQLMPQALQTGNYLMEQLRQLSGEFPIIADVRGYGLFLGVELMDPANPQQAATSATAWLIEYLKAHRVLLSSEGPDANILKIKPPLVFGRREADRFLATLRDGLQVLDSQIKHY